MIIDAESKNSKNDIGKKIDHIFDRYFELWDEDDSGTIDRKEFYNLLRLNIVGKIELKVSVSNFSMHRL